MARCALIVYLFLISTICSYNLSHLYVGDFHLVVDNSPYIVVSDVTIRSTSRFVIDNGVEIIFLDDYTISVYGSFHACRHLDLNVTSVLHIRGLSNPSKFTYIHGIATKSRIGRISLLCDYCTKSSFCNTKFENMNTGIYAIRSQYSNYVGPYYVDNCEFSNLWNAMHIDTDNINSITNSYIHDVQCTAYNGPVFYDNLLLTNFTKFACSSQTGIIIENSEVIGNGNSFCIAGAQINNNTVSSCSTCIYGYQSITGNTIRNCSQYGISGGGYISNNIFVNNTGTADILVSQSTQITNNIFRYSNTAYQIQITVNSAQKIQNNIFDGHNGENVIRQTSSLHSYGGRVDVLDNQFINNIEAILIYTDSLDFNIQNNTFENNIVTNPLGASLIYSQSPTNITNNVFLLNQIHGTRNSSIYHINSKYTFVKYNNFTNNELKTSIAKLAKDSNNILHIETPYKTIEYNVFSNNIVTETYDTNSSITNNVIYSNAYRYTIKYNNFSETNINAYIYLDGNSEDYLGRSVQYNNFLTDQQPFFIMLDSDSDLTAATYNYFGGIIDIQQLSSKMDDVCHYLNDGFITFWPYYQSPIQDFYDSNNLPPICRYRAVSCDFNAHGNALCETVTISPTQSPSTVAPTMSPSTVAPTTSPSTVAPTMSPTLILPTTVQPTLIPTQSRAPAIYIETTPMASHDDGNINNDNKSEMTTIWIIVASVALLFLFASGIILYRHCKGKEKNDIYHVPLKNMMQSEVSNQPNQTSN